MFTMSTAGSSFSYPPPIQNPEVPDLPDDEDEESVSLAPYNRMTWVQRFNDLKEWDE